MLFTIAPLAQLKFVYDFLSYLEYCSLPIVTQFVPMGGLSFFFQISSFALILESPTGPMEENGMQEMKKDLSAPANLVTEVSAGFSSSRPASAIIMPGNSMHVIQMRNALVAAAAPERHY